MEMFHPPGELPPSMLKRAKTYVVPAVEPVPVAAPVRLHLRAGVGCEGAGAPGWCGGDVR
eukprot:4009088-Amphidinium_carterae.1